MSFDFTEYKENDYLIPTSIENKNEYYSTLNMIENTTTGRTDAQIANVFVRESVSLIINAIVLFEKGYFDNASYSLRQSLELSTTMVYLIELAPVEKEKQYKDWKEQNYFPLQGRMLKFLNENKESFSDIKQSMEKYFEELEVVKNQLNKITHKQGFHTFHTIRWPVENWEINMRRRLNGFIYHLEKCIGAIAILRLSVDPFPVLLMDEEIYVRTEDTITEPYSEEFFEKYIGSNHLESYKETRFYKEIHKEIMKAEKKSLGVLNLVKNQFIERGRAEEINNQKHLLSSNAIFSFVIASLYDHVSYVYINQGMHYYFTETKTNRLDGSVNTMDFHKVKKSNNHFNNPYQGAFLSYIKVLEDDYFFKHNERLSKDEIEMLFKIMDNPK